MNTIRFTLAGVSAAALLVACGGSPSPAAPAATGPTITGLAATGAALGNATVSAKCATGAPLAGKTLADGSFVLDLSGGQTAPCLIQVTNGTVTLHSFASASGRINVTPLTDLVVTKALGSNAAAAFASFDATKSAAIKAGLDAAKVYVKAQITALTGGSQSGDPLTSEFKIGDADDKVLDTLAAKLVTEGKVLDDLRQGAAGSGSFVAALARGKLVSPAAVVPFTYTVAQFNGSPLAPISGPAVCDVKVVSINYKTIGVNGEAANASGVLLLPTGAGVGCASPAGLVAYAKGTDVQKPRTLANPADGETFLLAAMYAAQGYAVVATDYLGFAQSTYAYHPYLHADSEASSVIDSIRAARIAAKQAGVDGLLNGKVMLTGYSQGGHASMAAHRAIERDNASEINVVAGAHLAGPYNLSGSLKVTQAVGGVQFFVPYLVTAWQKIYGNIYSNVSDVFNAPYDGYIESLLPSPTLDYTTLVTTGKLPGGPGFTPNQARDAVFKAAFTLDGQTNNNSPLFLAGKKNDLLGWNPKAKVLLCGGAGDPTVPPVVQQQVMKADFDSRGLTNVTSVDVDPSVQAVYGAVLAADPATYYGSYHGSYEPPFCHAAGRGLFNTVK